MSWKNRIVGHGEQAAISFMANPRNWRIHPKAQREALTGVLSEVGWVQSVIVNRTTGNVVDGHARIEEALKLGDETPVPFVEVELSEEEEKQVLLTLDPISAMAAADKQNLDSLLHDVSTASSAVADMLTELADKNGLEYGATIGGELEDVEPQVDRADELRRKWGVESGQIWQLGEHRLMCGDSTSDDDVTRLMNGEKADMMFTDPPYGVDYSGGIQFQKDGAVQKNNREKLKNDDTTQIYNDFLPVALSVVDGPCYMWFAGSKARDVYNAVYDNECEVHALIIWHKTNATYAAMNAQYKQRHEPCLYFKPRGSTLRWCGKTTEATVWSQDRDGINEFHPTQKPIALATKALKNHEVATVLDMFCGSGSTLIAAEQLGRKCYAMEISPGFVAVALERWSQATGKTPDLVA